MTAQIIFVVVALVAGVILLRVLRSGQLREKYAALWVILGAVIIVLGVWPGLLEDVARLVGVQLASNLLFFLAILLLLGVTLHLSLAVSKLEEQTRTLAEEVSILRLDFEQSQRDGSGPTGH